MLNIMYIGGHEPSLDCPPETAKMSYFPQVPAGTAPENFDVAVFHHVDLFLSAQNQWDSLAKQYILLVDHQAEALLLSHRQNIGKPNIHMIPRNCGNVVFTITLDKIQKIISGLETSPQLSEWQTAEKAHRRKIIHALRTPLNSIVGYTEILMEEFQSASPEDIEKDLNSILSTSHQLKTLINKIDE